MMQPKISPEFAVELTAIILNERYEPRDRLQRVYARISSPEAAQPVEEQRLPQAKIAFVMNHKDPEAYCLMAAFKTKAEALKVLSMVDGTMANRVKHSGEKGATS